MIDKAYQATIREQKAMEIVYALFARVPPCIDLKVATTREIDYKTASTIILEYEWLGTMPLPKSCRFMYGIYFNGILGGAIVYVEPSTRAFYKEYPRQAVQLNRGACAYWTPKNTATKLIAASLADLRSKGVKIIIAYCTQEAGEVGTIYQALGWWYVGNAPSSKVYLLDGHWVSERTLADKIAWAKNRAQRWQDKFAELPSKELAPKFKYVKLLVQGSESVQICKLFGFTPLPYPKRGEV